MATRQHRKRINRFVQTALGWSGRSAHGKRRAERGVHP